MDLFVAELGKDSPNAAQVKLMKVIFPNGCNYEKNPGHQQFLKKLFGLCEGTFTCSISHLVAGAQAVHEQMGLKGRIL